MERYSPDKKYRIMSRDEVRAVDAWAIDKVGVPGVVLMENAGRSCAELVKNKLAHVDHPTVCFVCGKGNNGGDGCECPASAQRASNEGVLQASEKIAAIRKSTSSWSSSVMRSAAGYDSRRLVRGFIFGRQCGLDCDALFGTGQGDCTEALSSLSIPSMLSRPVLAVDSPLRPR
jgi:NAD(P)H-hydrate epimerase